MLTARPWPCAAACKLAGKPNPQLAAKLRDKTMITIVAIVITIVVITIIIRTIVVIILIIMVVVIIIVVVVVAVVKLMRRTFA